MKIKRIAERCLKIYIPVTLFLGFTLLPFYWILISSFKREIDVMKKPLQYWPNPGTLENYINMWLRNKFVTYFLNSILVSVCTVGIIMVLTILGGYALSRYKFRGKTLVYIILLLTQMLPAVVIVIPLFEIFKGLRLINNPLALILTYSTTQLSFCMIMMSGFFSAIPPTLEEAAQIDGCSLPGAVIRVVVPSVLPGMVAVGAFAFVGSWNNFLYALSFITDRRKYPISLGLSMMKGEFVVEYAALCAACVIALIPVVLLFAYIQKYLVTGLTAGAVKG
jgi:multiple sugar transport system permease protein